MTEKKKTSTEKTGGEGFIEVTHTNKATKAETVVENDVFVFPFKGGNAEVSFYREVPCQLAPYMYMKTSVGIRLPVKEDVESINKAYEFAETWVDNLVQKTLDDYAGVKLTKVDKV